MIFVKIMMAESADICKTNKMAESADIFRIKDGGISWYFIKGAVTGPTNSAIIAEQFRRLKFGDRFFFTHGYRFIIFKSILGFKR